MSKNGTIKSEIRMKLEDFVLYDRTLCFLAFVKVTYITEWYKWYNYIKSSIVEKS